jgi:hypothetical protein
LLQAYGPRMLFGLSIVAALAVAVPPHFDWLGERGRAADSRGCAADSRRLCADVCAHRTKRLVALSAAMVGAYSITLGLVQIVVGASYPASVQAFTVTGNSALAILLCAKRATRAAAAHCRPLPRVTPHCRASGALHV